jgi:hypothetical protein
VWQETQPVTAIDVMSGTQTVSVRYDVSTTVWSLVTPVQDTADPIGVGNIAESLKSLRAGTAITDSSDLAQFGLDNPPMRVKVQTGGNTPATHELLVGDATFDGSQYYVKEASKAEVYTVSNGVIEPLKSWLTTPPVAPPTPTPLPLATPIASEAITGTVTLPVTTTATTSLSGSATITTTAPGAANPTTPLVSTPEGSPAAP